ncbi:MAG TPA: hypothetical protein VMI56_06560 [Reyranella sp.]|nr:hypothetical protein [Reyranella sp.]
MALPTALLTGAVAGVTVPWLVNHSDDLKGGVLAGDYVRIPIGGIDFHWSWLVFSLVTVIAWGALKAVQND